jgi:hypothetical protein
MKINWGWGIVIFIVLFMSFILTLVYKCTQQSVDLVSDKYYEEELMYQTQVDKRVNVSDLNEKLKVNFNEESRLIEIQYPAFVDTGDLSGNIIFYKPNDPKLDFTVNVHPDHKLSQLIPSVGLTHGLWRLKISWNASGTEYYQEEKILIN